MSTRMIAIAGGLSALSAVVQLVHIGYQSPQFGMWIDIVAVSWLIAFFMFGGRMALVVSLMGALVITLFAPDTWLGASMKWVASMPMWLILAIWAKIFRKSFSHYQSVRFLLIPVCVALIVRCTLVIPLNYYYAIPIWTGMTTSEAMSAIPWYVIALFNIIQGILEVALAWVVVHHFKLKRFASHHISE